MTEVEVKYMDGVSEYRYGLPVRIGVYRGKMVFFADTQDGHDGVAIDLLQLMAWLNRNFNVELATKIYEANGVGARVV